MIYTFWKKVISLRNCTQTDPEQTHPWLRSFSVLSNHNRTATALPSRHWVKISSISTAAHFFSYGALLGVDLEIKWSKLWR